MSEPDEFTYAPTGQPGFYKLRRTGVDVGEVYLSPSHFPLQAIVMMNIVGVMNDPPPPELFAGPALDVLDQYRQGRR